MIFHNQCSLQTLLDKLQEGSVGTGNNGVIAGVLATVGELARVVSDHNSRSLLAGRLSYFVSYCVLLTCYRQMCLKSRILNIRQYTLCYLAVRLLLEYIILLVFNRLLWLTDQGGCALRQFMPDLMRPIVDALMDGASISKREVAVSTLGKVVESTG